MGKAASGDRVLIHYRVRLNSGEIIDLSPDGEPLEVFLGVGRYLPAIEETVVGMAPGEERSVTVPAEKAFGARIDDMVQELGRDLFPEETPPEVGQTFIMGDPSHGGMMLTVVAVDGDRIVVDANHPLAGEDLLVDVALKEILPPDQEALMAYIRDAAENDPCHDHEDGCGCGCGCEDDCDCGDGCDCGDEDGDACGCGCQTDCDCDEDCDTDCKCECHGDLDETGNKN